MIPRDLASVLTIAARHSPVVTLTGPRQSGKTTLCRATFPHLPYRTLEPRDARAFAIEDPRGFLMGLKDGGIIDEIQRAPDLLGYLQEEVDRDPRPGRFILTGSENLAVTQAVSQSLAGRTAMLHLLPLSRNERKRFPSYPHTLLETLFEGGYPRIADQGMSPARWIEDYVSTYVERDVRQILQVGDLEAFGTFLRLCAGRTAQELNLAELGSDAGISAPTARSWLSVLEASYLVVRIPAWHRNVRKQQTHRPKIHFLDSGLACHLLGITEAAQLATHPLRGPLFESWVASEVFKARLHRGLRPSLFHHRETRGAEVDLLLERGDALIAIEVKAGATVKSEALRGLSLFAAHVGEGGDARPVQQVLAYGGSERQDRSQAVVAGWDHLADLDWGRAA